MSRVRLSSVCLAVVLVVLSIGTASAAGKHVYLLRGIFNVSTGLDALAAKLRKSGIRATVYSHGQSGEVAAEAIRDYKARRVGSIVLIGHSLGAAGALAVAEDLNRANIPVSLLVTLDQGGLGPIPRNVRRAVNFFAGGSGTVSGDKNFRGSLRNVDVGNVPGMSHMRIQDMKVMHDRLMGLVRGG